MVEIPGFPATARQRTFCYLPNMWNSLGRPRIRLPPHAAARDLSRRVNRQGGPAPPPGHLAFSPRGVIRAPHPPPPSRRSQRRRRPPPPLLRAAMELLEDRT